MLKYPYEENYITDAYRYIISIDWKYFLYKK